MNFFALTVVQHSGLMLGERKVFLMAFIKLLYKSGSANKPTTKNKQKKNMQTQSNLYSVIRTVLAGNLKLSTLFTLFLAVKS